MVGARLLYRSQRPLVVVGIENEQSVSSDRDLTSDCQRKLDVGDRFGAVGPRSVGQSVGLLVAWRCFGTGSSRLKGIGCEHALG